MPRRQSWGCGADALPVGHLKFYGDLELGPGDYDLRILVRTGTTGRYGLRRVPLSVSGPNQAGPHLLEPVFFDDPERPSIVVREAEPGAKSGAVPASYPFRIGDVSYFPAVHRSFASDRPARMSLMAYELEKKLRLQAQVRRGDGALVDQQRLAVVAQDERGELRQIFFAFQPQGLEPGEYTFQVALLDPRTEKTYASSTTFQLTE